MHPGKLGVWGLFNDLTALEYAALARRIEAWGYGTLWLPEALGRDLLVAASWLLANTTKLNIATGIAVTYARDSLTAVNAQYGLAEQSGGRFLMGLGVSHGPVVEGVRGHRYEQPVAAMTAYLDGMARARYQGAAPPEPPMTIIAALGPRMLQLAAEHADGAHTYNVSPDHTARAREILGPGKLLCAEQKVIFETDPAAARAIGRRVLGYSLDLPNYRAHFLRQGFSEADLETGGSDRLVDSVIAWGDERAIRERIAEHWSAGADHVCIQCLPTDGMAFGRGCEEVLALLSSAAG